MPKRSPRSSNSTRKNRSDGTKHTDAGVPTFANNKELIRYVPEEARSGNRVSPAAFLPDPPDPTRKRPPYLSVNSLEIESLQAIANYHREVWQKNSGKVALAAHKVFHYREAGRQSGVTIEYDREQRQYVFREKTGGMSRAFECIPRTNIYKSPSHSGVHFVRALAEHQIAKFARRMSGGKFHSL